jgi:SH3 domain protein
MSNRVIRNLLTLALCSLCLNAVSAAAQTRYVSDELVITFRTGPGSQFAITRNLTSGARVEVLEAQSDPEGFSRVRLQDGTEGWVLTRYLQSEPTATQQLTAAKRSLEEASQRADQLEQRVKDLEAELGTKSQALAESETKVGDLNSDLADIRSKSASAIETSEENAELKKRLAELSSASDATRMELDQLRRRERQNWFIIGAAVLFGGVVIGLVAPSLRPKRRSSW